MAIAATEAEGPDRQVAEQAVGDAGVPDEHVVEERRDRDDSPPPPLGQQSTCDELVAAIERAKATRPSRASATASMADAHLRDSELAPGDRAPLPAYRPLAGGGREERAQLPPR